MHQAASPSVSAIESPATPSPFCFCCVKTNLVQFFQLLLSHVFCLVFYRAEALLDSPVIFDETNEELDDIFGTPFVHAKLHNQGQNLVRVPAHLFEWHVASVVGNKQLRLHPDNEGCKQGAQALLDLVAATDWKGRHFYFIKIIINFKTLTN